MAWEKIKNWGSLVALIVNLGVLAGLLVQCGRLQSGLDDVHHIRRNLEVLAGKVDGLNTSGELIKAKINNEIIPRLNNDPKIKPLAGIPVHKAFTLGELKYNWAVPYKARGGESVDGILMAAGVPKDPNKVKEVLTTNPDGFKKTPTTYPAGFVAAPGATILIPVSDNYVEKLVQESVQFDERPHWKVIPAPPPGKASEK